MGLTDYYRRFVKDYGKIAKPLTDFLKKKAWNLTTEAEDAFKRSQTVVTTTPMLRLPYLSQPFAIKYDASGGELGIVLLQRQPIAYFSKALAPTALSKSIYEKL